MANAKKVLRIVVNVSMFALFAYLICYHSFGGILSHGVAGILLLTLVIVHNLQNANFWKNVLKGKYRARRILLLTINILLAVFALITFISAAKISGKIFECSPFGVSWQALQVHRQSSAWCFFIMLLHLSIHAKKLHVIIWSKLYNLKFYVKVIYFAINATCFVCAIFALCRSEIFANMFILTDSYEIWQPAEAVIKCALIALGAISIQSFALLIKRQFCHQ